MHYILPSIGEFINVRNYTNAYCIHLVIKMVYNKSLKD